VTTFCAFAAKLMGMKKRLPYFLFSVLDALVFLQEVQCAGRFGQGGRMAADIANAAAALAR